MYSPRARRFSSAFGRRAPRRLPELLRLRQLFLVALRGLLARLLARPRPREAARTELGCSVVGLGHRAEDDTLRLAVDRPRAQRNPQGRAGALRSVVEASLDAGHVPLPRSRLPHHSGSWGSLGCALLPSSPGSRSDPGPGRAGAGEISTWLRPTRASDAAADAGHPTSGGRPREPVAATRRAPPGGAASDGAPSSSLSCIEVTVSEDRQPPIRIRAGGRHRSPRGGRGRPRPLRHPAGSSRG